MTYEVSVLWGLKGRRRTDVYDTNFLSWRELTVKHCDREYSAIQVYRVEPPSWFGFNSYTDLDLDFCLSIYLSTWNLGDLLRKRSVFGSEGEPGLLKGYDRRDTWVELKQIGLKWTVTGITRNVVVVVLVLVSIVYSNWSVIRFDSI